MKKFLAVSAFVTAVLAGLMLTLVGWLRGDSASQNADKTLAQLNPIEPTRKSEVIPTWNEPEAEDERRYAYRLPGMDCLVNQYGIRRKVIITQQNVRCVNEPSTETATGAPLRFFMPYFVFNVFPQEGDITFFQIGPTPQRDSIIGWVPASQVAPWDTRVGARYIRSAGSRTPPLLVYQNAEALEELVKSKTTQQQPMARAAHESSRTWMPWPITEVRQITHDGRTYELLRLNFLGEHKSGGELQQISNVNHGRSQDQYSEVEIQKIKSGVKMLDVIFVVDTTLSTTSHIAAMRESVRMITSRLQELPFKPDLNCGLVEYRDFVPSIMFEDGGQSSPVKFYPLEADLRAFLARVEEVKEAQQHSEEFPEAVFDGLFAALTRPHWRGEGLSARVVVLIGDNSGHEAGHPKNPDNITVEQLVRTAKERDRNVKIFSLCVEGGGGEPERLRHQQQFRELAQGTGGECFPLDEAQKVVDRVKVILESETAVVHKRSVVLDALTEGKSTDQIAAEKQIDVREVTEVMEFLAGGGVDLERLKPGIPTFATGWCLAELEGVPLLEKEVYAARAELDMLLSELNSLCVQLSPDLARRAFRTGVGSRINPMSFFAERRPEPMDVFLMAKGIPCSQGLLKLTRSDIEHMPEEQRAVLRERIARQVVPQLTNARNNDEYFTWLDDLEFGWVSESLLP